MSQTYSAWIATLQSCRRGLIEGSFGRPSERQLHVAKLDESIDFLKLCEKHKVALTVVLGLSNGPQQ